MPDHRKQFLDILANIQSCDKAIDEAKATIEANKKEISKLKASITPVMKKQCQEMTLGQIASLFNEMYWTRSDFAGAVKDAYLSLFGTAFHPTPKKEIIICRECRKNEVVFLKTSWGKQSYRQKPTCKECHDRFEKEYEEEERERKARIEERKNNLTRLKTMPYDDYLQTDHWKEMRQVALRRANCRCQMCNTDKTLQVHHRTYIRRGEEYPNDLTVVCRKCHETHHGIKDEEE